MSEKPKSGAPQLAELATLTPARVALGRSGASVPTREVLRFGMAHAQARDAVHAPFDADGVARRLAALGLEVIQVDSAAGSREAYLRRPDLGRSLSPGSREALTARYGDFDLAFIVADGLSSTAVHRNAVPLVAALLPLLARQGLRLAPLVVGRQARVALGDEIGAAFGARAVAMLIGERPGLSSPDSLGAYLTFAPRAGLTDANRNCISNIRPEGLAYEPAAFKLSWLIAEALRRSLTGIGLKDESDLAIETNETALSGAALLSGAVANTEPPRTSDAFTGEGDR
ncbi:MAG: ethanolamine ammonia-lyase subunit EutC [Bosea sp.]|uniref:ethanolamine ammonia-lyase subunit EutC n=1 Tax=Bosea sp. (in: a-proteobacteria) TaxID=1871050 RepID=UPI001AD49E11|nr:ethanolamine ammonia-lyase subunit EutC [Bosea sp. (in: a-proteobacteria)]MBN9471612.1 ethanolamine ammonia-lyase subunit EutC [Bosea sp. (in: a-proteobacteria)]